MLQILFSVSCRRYTIWTFACLPASQKQTRDMPFTLELIGRLHLLKPIVFNSCMSQNFLTHLSLSSNDNGASQSFLTDFRLSRVNIFTPVFQGFTRPKGSNIWAPLDKTCLSDSD